MLFIALSFLLLTSFSLIKSSKEVLVLNNVKNGSSEGMNGILPLSNYMYLKTLYTLTHGENWYDAHGWNFTDYQNNSPCLQEWFGIVAYAIGVDGSCLIVKIALENNNLRGILPPVLANFTNLQVFSVVKNHLYGPLPIVRECPMLTNLAFAENALTGPIPSNMFYDDNKNNNNTKSFLDTLKLQHLQFSNNLLTNTLPSWIYSIKSLYRLSLDYNDLTGTISHEIINLMNINLIYLNNNRFSGTLPIEFLFLKRLSGFVIASNFLSGTIKLPSSLINPTSLRTLNIADNNFEGLLPSVEVLTKILQVVFYSNYFSGTIDKSYCSFKGTRLSLSDNLLSGTVPSCIWKNNLIQLELDYNQFHGSVDFPIPDASNFKSFKTRFLSLGYNYFSGTFPWHILYYPDLYGVSASNNCFSNDISSIHCNQTISHNVHVFSFIHIDNLYSSKHCHSKKKKKSSDIFFNNQRRSFGGKFPACLLLTTKIGEIFASGNGFTGTIPSNSFMIDRPSPLNLNLSYNYLTGTIPLITSKFHSLDLSYNKFSGNININNTNYLFMKNDSALILKKNRLSGKMNIIQPIDYYDKIEIVEGNMMDCKSIISHKDSFSQVYTCESTTLDNSLIVFLISFCCVLVVILFYYYCFAINRFPFNLNLFRSPDLQSFSSFVALRRYIILIQNIILYCLISMGILLIVLPSYTFGQVSDVTRSKKFENVYRWMITSVYIRGSVFTILILVVLLSLIVLLPLILSKGGGLEFKARNRSDRTKFASNWKINCLVYLLFLLIFVLNGFISFSIYTFYLMAANNRKNDEGGLPSETEVVLVQMGLGLYNVIWNRYVLVFVLRYLRMISKGLSLCGSGEGWWDYEYGLMLLLMNSVIGPWLSVMLRDESCFEKLLLSDRNIMTPIGLFEYEQEDLSHSRISHQKIAFPLPFFYYFDCGSKLLSSITPIVLYTYSLQFFFILFSLLLNDFIRKYNNFSKKYLQLFQASSTENVIYADYSQNIALDLCNVLCFGIHHPLLGVSVIMKIIFELIVQRRRLLECIHGTEIISLQRDEIEFNPISSALDKSDHSVENQQLEGRSEMFKTTEVQSSSSSYHLVTEIKEDSQSPLNMENLANLVAALNSTPYCTTGGIWVIINLSLLFNIIVLFDIVGDESGAETALWVPIFIALLIVIGFLFRIVNLFYTCKRVSLHTFIYGSSNTQDFQEYELI